MIYTSDTLLIPKGHRLLTAGSGLDYRDHMATDQGWARITDAVDFHLPKKYLVVYAGQRVIRLITVTKPIVSIGL